MKRRRFIQAAAALLAGAKSALARGDSGPAPKRRRVLVTSAEHSLAMTIAKHLTPTHYVRLTAVTDVQTDLPFTKCGLGPNETTDALVRDTDVIVHVAEPPAGADERTQIDHRTRLTYNLLWAASMHSVRKVVLLSSLDLFTAYDEDYEVTEDWAPRPAANAEALSHHLGEFTCREFARESKIDVVVLRLGKVVRSEKVAGQDYDPMWVDELDVATAVDGAVRTDFQDDPSRVHSWRVFHVQSDSKKARFTSGRAKGQLGFAPTRFGDA